MDHSSSSPHTSRQTIVVTDGEQRSALALVRSLGRAGHTVHVCSASGRSLAGASRFAATDTALPDALDDPDAFADALRAHVTNVGAQVLIPMTEAALLATLPRRTTFAARIPFADADVFAGISDKQRVLAEAQRVGIAAPSQHVLSSPSDAAILDRSALRYPLVVKPTRSVAGDGKERAKFSVIHVANAEALDAVLTRIDSRAYPLLLQQRVVGPGVGIFVLVWDGQLVAAFSHRRLREKPPSGGVSVYRESFPLDASLLERSRALLDAFQWQGVAMVEYKVDEATGTPYLMEINGRFWGSLQLAIDAGVDFPTLLLAADAGESPTPVTSYRTDVRSRWWWGDVDHLIARMTRSPEALALPPGAPSRGAALRDFFTNDHRDVNEIRQPDDPRPFLRETQLWLQSLI